MINSVGNYYRPVAYQAQPQSQRQIQPSFKGEENEGMSKTSKTLLGLGALAAVGIGGLLLKKRIDLKNANKLFKENFVSNFEKEYGKFVDKGEELNLGSIIKYCIDNNGGKACKAHCVRLNKDGLNLLFGGKELPETLLGRKDGVLVRICDSENKMIKSKVFIADKIDNDLSETFQDALHVVLE